MVMTFTHSEEIDNWLGFKSHFKHTIGQKTFYLQILIKCHHFPYLLNVVCKNTVLQRYMACGRVLLNHQDGASIGNQSLI